MLPWRVFFEELLVANTLGQDGFRALVMENDKRNSGGGEFPMTAEQEVETKIFGAHEFQFVPPDVLRFKISGELDDAGAEQYLDFLFSHGDKQGRLLYGIFELTALTRFSEAARKRVLGVGKPYPYGGVAIIGASFPIRALVSMLMRAGIILSPKYLGFPYKFVTNVDEANAWFDELRRS